MAEKKKTKEGFEPIEQFGKGWYWNREQKAIRYVPPGPKSSEPTLLAGLKKARKTAKVIKGRDNGNYKGNASK